MLPNVNVPVVIVPTAELVSQAALSTQEKAFPPMFAENCSTACAGVVASVTPASAVAAMRMLRMCSSLARICPSGRQGMKHKTLQGCCK